MTSEIHRHSPAVWQQTSPRSFTETFAASRKPVHFDPRDLKLLDTLYATRSVTKTAELLGQTQPTVSSC